MATYRKRKNQDGSIGHQFIIRRKGFPAVVRTFERKTDGEAWVQDTESAIRNGRFLDPRRSEGMTVSELVDNYKSEKKFQDRRSKQTPTQTLDWWQKRIGALAIGRVSRPLIEQHWAELAKEKSERTGKTRSDRTLNAYLETLSACFSYAVKKEWIEKNPILKVERKSLSNRRRVVLSNEQLSKLLKAADSSRNRYLKVALLMTISTGGRRGEIMGLEWSNVDLQSGEIHFPITKNGDARTVVLGTAALEALKGHAKIRHLDCNLVFPPLKQRRLGAKAKFSTPWEDLRAPFKRACKFAGITGVRWHDLRHCAASYLMMSGASLTEMMKILGHRSGAMSWHYSHLDQKRTAELVNKVDRKYLSTETA